jgi:hypothetical protein
VVTREPKAMMPVNSYEHAMKIPGNLDQCKPLISSFSFPLRVLRGEMTHFLKVLPTAGDRWRVLP